MVRKCLPYAWALLLSLLLLGPALGPGFVLGYDLVWVPDLALRADFLGLGSALPRAVPSDAVVAVLDQVVPGELLEKLVLLGSLVLAGGGIQRLVGGSTLARVVAVSVYLWNPFVVERLLIGHWTVLLAYAVLPWLVVEGVRHRREGRISPLLLVLLPLGCLSAGAGLMSALVLLVAGLPEGRRRWRGGAVLLGLGAAANAPWLVSGLLHVSTATSTGAGSVFGLGDEGGLPGPFTALTLGGIWNTETVPGSRDSLPLLLVATALACAAAALGARPLVRRLGGRTAVALAVLWSVGYAVAVLSWAAPGAVGWSAAHVPGGGLLRDGSRNLALCAPLLATAVAAGAERLAGHWRDRGVWLLVGAAGALLPLALMPDAAWGIGNRLVPVSYPDDYAQARAVLVSAGEAGDVTGDLLVLPFTSYRAPDWNGQRKVLDPVGRYLPRDYLTSDQLAVSGRVLAGEDPRVPQVLAALALETPAQRAAALGELGVGVVARERGVPTTETYDAPVAGTVLFDSTALELVRIEAPVAPDRTPGTWVAALAAGWLAFLGLPVAALALAARRLALRRMRGKARHPSRR